MENKRKYRTKLPAVQLHAWAQELSSVYCCLYYGGVFEENEVQLYSTTLQMAGVADQGKCSLLLHIQACNFYCITAAVTLETMRRRVGTRKREKNWRRSLSLSPFFHPFSKTGD